MTGLDVSESYVEPSPPDSIQPPSRETLVESNATTEEGLENLPFASLSEALGETPSEPEWLVDGYLANGVLTLLAGRPKAGKSTFLFGVLESLQSGREFVGRSVRRSTPLLLSEERPGTLASKADAFAVGAITLLMQHQAAGANWPLLVGAAIKECRRRQHEVLVVDTLHAFAGLAGDSENNAGAQLAAIAPLQVAAASGLAVLAVVHQRKSGGEHGEAVRGSNALTGAVDIVVELERLPGSLAGNPSARLLKAIGRFPSTPSELVIEYGDDGYTAAGDIGQARETTETMRLLEALVECDATADQLAAALGMSKSTAQRRLEKAEANRLLTKTGAGKRGDPYVYSIQPVHSPSGRIE